MTDPITCPECEGEGGQHLGRLRIACSFCHGRGWVGAEHEPAESPPPPAEPPPVWEHRIWSDSAVAAFLGCRYCLGSEMVAHLDETTRTLVMVPCGCRAPGDLTASA
ncbi:hypothetical protein AB0K21_43725 [Streptosporangium sp. NPDC049248]|uniref:hypothetical protein n=1 Tax=Streptosporangium sp. NPDC049248 TaxID=3155651 RepID=UPI003446FF59